MRFVSLAQESIIDISIFGATPFFQKFFQQPIPGAWLDLQVHPNASIPLSNSAGHVRLSLGFPNRPRRRPDTVGQIAAARLRHSATRRKRHAADAHALVNPERVP